MSNGQTTASAVLSEAITGFDAVYSGVLGAAAKRVSLPAWAALNLTDYVLQVLRRWRERKGAREP